MCCRCLLFAVSIRFATLCYVCRRMALALTLIRLADHASKRRLCTGNRQLPVSRHTLPMLSVGGWFRFNYLLNRIVRSSSFGCLPLYPFLALFRPRADTAGSDRCVRPSSAGIRTSCVCVRCDVVCPSWLFASTCVRCRFDLMLSFVRSVRLLFNVQPRLHIVSSVHSLN